MIDRVEEITEAAVRQGILGPDTTVVGFVDFDRLEERAAALRRTYPASFRHRFAVKANPSLGFLSEVRRLGLLAEAASPGEVEACRRAGWTAAEIFYNSPTKTRGDLVHLAAGDIAFSMDNAQEAERFRALPGEGRAPAGLRINTQVGVGAMEATSTAAATSKFGFPLTDPGGRAAILAAFAADERLDLLHVHTGSQGMALDVMVESVARLVDLADDIDRACGRPRVRCLNIGGGLPWSPLPDRGLPDFADHAAALRARVPALHSGRFAVETEFGRALASPSGFAVTRVEYTKSAGGRAIALTHAGAQVVTRSVLAPDQWPLHLDVLDRSGRRATRPLRRVDVAGPCCFAGDLLCKDRELPEIHPDDFVVLHGAGAYGFANHYDFNLLPAPVVLAVRRRRGAISFDEIPRETVADPPRDLSFLS